jgi:hypothetical protein
MNINTRIIADGKLPNKYFVSISEDYYIYNEEENSLNWISEQISSFKPKYLTIKSFNTYREAKEYAYDIFDSEINIKVNSVSVEDRLSGQVFEIAKVFYPTEAVIKEEMREDIEFTKQKLGYRFK